MASIEFLQNRAAGKEKEIEKLNKKLERILKAKESNWEKNPYWYNERDLVSTEKEIAQAEEALQDYLDKIEKETQKANSRNITAILEFLEGWKDRMRDYYHEQFDKYIEALNEWYAYDHEYTEWSNSEGYKMFKEDPVEYKRRKEEYRQARKEFTSRWAFISDFTDYTYNREKQQRSYVFLDDKFNKMLDQDANAKYDFIVERTNDIVGTITDASNLRVGAKGDLNGYIIGTDGTAKVQTIGAGGYNIQAFHYRTLISPVK